MVNTLIVTEQAMKKSPKKTMQKNGKGFVWRLFKIEAKRKLLLSLKY